MNDQLQPRTLSEILDRTAQLYRSRFLVFLGIATIPAGTIFLFAAGIFAFVAWIGANARHGATVADVLIWVFLIVLLLLVVPGSLAASSLGEAAISDASARFILGESITIRNAYQTAWKKGWRYVGLYLLQGLAIVCAPAAVFAIALFAMIAAKVSGSNDGGVVFSGLVLLLIVILGAVAVRLLLRLCLAFPACVVERTTAWSAIKRSVHLSQGTRGRIFLLYVLGVVLNQIMAWVITFPTVIALALIPGLQGKAHERLVGMIAMFVIYGSYFIVRALTKPIYGIALTLFYFDQRIRKEGFDIEWMMLKAGMLPVEPAIEVVPVTPAEPVLPAKPETSSAAAAIVVSATDPAEAASVPDRAEPPVRESGGSPQPVAVPVAHAVFGEPARDGEA